MKRRRAEDVFWNLAALVSDYVLELPANRLSADALRSGLQPRTRVCVPADGRPLPDVVAATGEVAAAGMRPVITARAPALDRSAVHASGRALDELVGVGGHELVLRWPASSAPAEVLDGVVRLVTECGLGGWCFGEIGIAADCLTRRWLEPSAELLRAFDDVRAAGECNDIGFTLLVPPVRSVDSVVEWERSLRAAGNRLPVRVRLPGIGPNPFLRTVPILLGLAAAAESDPDSLLTELQFSLRGSPSRTTAFADEICRGNFVVEETVSGYRLSLLTARKG